MFVKAARDLLLIAKEILNLDKKVRKGAYWAAPGRTYRMTRSEQKCGIPFCPKCKVDMVKEPFLRSDKMWVCPICRFKVQLSKLVTKIHIDVNKENNDNLDLNLEVKTRRKQLCKGDVRTICV